MLSTRRTVVRYPTKSLHSSLATTRCFRNGQRAKRDLPKRQRLESFRVYMRLLMRAAPKRLRLLTLRLGLFSSRE
eukprot:180255-Prorocentrum_minimum.AAC.1